MLVLATIYIGTSQTLPLTSYIKMIDIWDGVHSESL